jgi:cytochrome P450
MSVEYEPLSPEWRPDPYPTFRLLRDRDPVHWAPESRCYCVSRYADALFVLKSPELFSSHAMFTMLMNGGEEEMPRLGWQAIRFIVRYALRVRLNPFAFPTARNLIATDPPVHGPMRNVVNRGFTPRQIAGWEPRIRELVSEQTAKLRAGELFDVVEDLAVPLPVTIIAEMLGVEPERKADFKRWSDGIIAGATGAERADRFHPRTIRTVLELNAYLRKIIRKRRRAPADDLVSAIVATQPGGAALTDLEVVLFVQLLLVAGNETTTNLIGNAVTALLDHPEQLERVCAHPALIPALVEETLRWDPPVQMVFRTARRDAEVAGTRIPEGAVVAVLLGSANRDERRFEDPDRFDVSRQARDHIAFGFGQHFCLGAALARLEARVALEALAPELSRLAPRAPERELIDSFLVRGPRRLELRPMGQGAGPGARAVPRGT